MTLHSAATSPRALKHGTFEPQQWIECTVSNRHLIHMYWTFPGSSTFFLFCTFCCWYLYQAPKHRAVLCVWFVCVPRVDHLLKQQSCAAEILSRIVIRKEPSGLKAAISLQANGAERGMAEVKRATLRTEQRADKETWWEEEDNKRGK